MTVYSVFVTVSGRRRRRRIGYGSARRRGTPNSSAKRYRYANSPTANYHVRRPRSTPCCATVDQRGRGRSGGGGSPRPGGAAGGAYPGGRRRRRGTRGVHTTIHRDRVTPPRYHSPALTPRSHVHALPDHAVTQIVSQVSPRTPVRLRMHSHLALCCAQRGSLHRWRPLVSHSHAHAGAQRRGRRAIETFITISMVFGLRPTHQAAADFLSAASKLMAPACKRSWV